MTFPGSTEMYVDTMPDVDDLACSAAAMADALAAARAAAVAAAVAGAVAGASAVLVVGERGAGKETVGRYVHQHSARAAGPFVPVDCTMLDPGCSVAELVGRSKGATPSATRDSLGLVRAADGGTLYLDEVAALDPVAQQHLLRLVRTATVRREGDGQPFPVDVRLVAATSVDLAGFVARRQFLPALADALSASAVRVPPLRDRVVDLPALARCLLRARARAFGEGVKTLTPPAAAALGLYAWPGNLPELAQLLDAAATRARGRQIDLPDLPGPLRQLGAARPYVN